MELPELDENTVQKLERRDLERLCRKYKIPLNTTDDLIRADIQQFIRECNGTEHTPLSPIKDWKDSEEVIHEKLHFRNYKPTLESLKKYVLKDPDLPTIISEINEKLQNLDLDFSHENLSNLAPKNPTWDLKRALAPKLERLETKTQRAIYEIMLEKTTTPVQ